MNRHRQRRLSDGTSPSLTSKVLLFIRVFGRSGLYPGGRALGCGPGGTLPSGHARRYSSQAVTGSHGDGKGPGPGRRPGCLGPNVTGGRARRGSDSAAGLHCDLKKSRYAASHGAQRSCSTGAEKQRWRATVLTIVTQARAEPHCQPEAGYYMTPGDLSLSLGVRAAGAGPRAA